MSIPPLAVIPEADVRALIEEKYAGDAAATGCDADMQRLAAGEPLAYVIGWIPFLGLHIWLDSRPLIPRPETEWWTEKLIETLSTQFGEQPFTFLDLCAGSGAIGCAVLKSFPHARVSFGELTAQHAGTIEKNIRENGLDPSRASIRTGDLFAPFSNERFDVIASNPPYIPEGRALPESVSGFEPKEALFAGNDGLALIRRIASETPLYLNENGTLWLECDAEHAETARELIAKHAKNAELRTDHYGRPRIIVGYY